MAKPSISLLLVCSFLFCFFFLRVSKAHQLAPALYVFGDSNVDAGNNNLFNTHAKANYPPYGIDFPSGIITGRPTNGYNIADFFAKWLGLNVPLAFRLVNGSTQVIHQGFNYGSSSAGILPDTATKMFKCVMSLGEQVDMFQKTVEEYLQSHFQSHVMSLSEHVSKSIYLVVMGVNDIGLNFLKKENSTNPVDYIRDVHLLVEKLGNRLKDLYKLGARKFVVFEIEAFGCLPFYVNKFKPVNSKCVDYLNAVVLMYNARLALKLQELQFKLEGSNFILGKYYDYTLSLVENPSLSGLKDASNPCCVLLPFGLCDPRKAPCRDRNSHAFFDAVHPTEAAYKVFAESCFSGIGSCVPMNVKQLATL
ncbi:GDSL esterase/lipase [Morus notabilis]|uniref:GDSL esterase/lipase n=1 Tax=Morus notabilis TaxID=981085 RepID=W9RYU9_9ROSA|nr:GDSL esterase/lipase [Morus notabilis]